MSPRAARWLLWLGLILIVPVPFFLAATGTVPPARVLMLGAITLAVVVAEGARGMTGVAAALLFAQALLYFALLWLAARLTVRALRSLSPAALAAVTGALLLAGVVWACSVDLYSDPFRSSGLRTNLLRVYE